MLKLSNRANSVKNQYKRDENVSYTRDPSGQKKRIIDCVWLKLYSAFHAAEPGGFFIYNGKKNCNDFTRVDELKRKEIC